MRKTKKNGFGWPLHPYQYLSYALIFYELPCTCALLCPVLLPPYQYLFIVIYVPLQVAVVIFGTLVTKADPTDPVVYQHRLAKQNQYSPPSEHFDSSRYASVCTICGTSVSNSSKHCGYCNRCVERFDHHCKWLNNCIGHTNYAQFTMLIGSLEVMELIIFVGSFWLLIQYFTQKDWLESHIQEAYGANIVELVFSCICVQTLIALLILIAIGNLIALHLWLRKCKKMTTFEYILHLRNHRNNTASSTGKTTFLSKIRESNANLSDIQLLMPKRENLVRKCTQVMPEDKAGESSHEVDETIRSRSEEEKVHVG